MKGVTFASNYPFSQRRRRFIAKWRYKWKKGRVAIKVYQLGARARESLFATKQRTNIQKYTKYISSGRLPER